MMLDAPVSGGVGGATAGTLTFMVGGTAQAFTRAESILQKMGKTIVHAGGAGNGQAAKICNNMILGVSMIAVSEAFVLAEKLGLDHQKLFDIASKSSGQCWSMTTYCPVPGPVPTSPANRDYQAGFTAAMMLKDLKLAQEAAKAAGAKTDSAPTRKGFIRHMSTAGRRARIFPASSASCADSVIRDGFQSPLIPAQAGIQGTKGAMYRLGPRFRGDERSRGERILAPNASIATSTKHSPLQINLIFMVLFKPILDCPL